MDVRLVCLVPLVRSLVDSEMSTVCSVAESSSLLLRESVADVSPTGVLFF